MTYAPEEPAPQPNAEAVKDFIMSPGSIRLEASLDKEVSIKITKIYNMIFLKIKWNCKTSIFVAKLKQIMIDFIVSLVYRATHNKCLVIN